MSQDFGEVGDEDGFLLLPSKQLVDEDLGWQFGPDSSLACSSQYIIVEKDGNVQFTAETRRKREGCGRLAGTELEQQWIGHEHGSSMCGLLCCPYCKQTKLIGYSSSLNDAAAGETRSTESRSAQLCSSEVCAVEGFENWHANETSPLCAIASLDNQQDIKWPSSSQAASQTGNHGEQQLKVAHLSSLFSGNSISDQVPLSQRFQCGPQPAVLSSRPESLVVSPNLPNQPYKRQQQSLEDVNRGMVTIRPEKLGAALCQSQTRARNAEKLASEALIEKEKLAKLFFKEVNTCRTYKKKIQLLELENLWLKKNVENNSEMWCELPSYYNISTSKHCKFYKRGFSKDSALAPGTMGLAFALGLSCASAGFVLGCCMGLMGLSH